jgi:hypothetical protein
VTLGLGNREAFDVIVDGELVYSKLEDGLLTNDAILKRMGV